MAEAIGAAATLISIIGFSAQVFDGCIKGFVLLSTANNLGRDADILRSRLDWEQFRLEQWAEKARLHDPAKADILVDWNLVTKTLEHIRNLTNDTNMLKEKYQLILIDEPPAYEEVPEIDEATKASVSRFKRLFGSSDRYNSTAAAKVIQTKTSQIKKLRWAAVDKKNMQSLIDDIAHFVGRLHDTLDSSIQTQMHKSLEMLLVEATNRYNNVPDLEYLKTLAGEIRAKSLHVPEVEADKLDEQIDKKFANLLHYAIGHDNVADVSELLDKGVDVNVEDHVGWSPLIKAAERDHLPMLQLLLKRGADPLKGTIGFRLPLHFAAEAGHVNTVRLLLQQPNVDANARDHTGRTPIFYAAGNGHEAVVKLLLEQPGIDPNPFNDSGFSPLLQAVFGDHTKIVELLLARGEVNPNESDREYKQTPLWMAAPHNDGEMVKLFLERKDLDLDSPSRFGETALGRCARQGYVASGTMLIAAGADVNKADDSGQTPLSSAAADGREEMVKLLLAHPQISVDVADEKGQTALHRASEWDKTKCVKLLLGHSPPAHVGIADRDGNLALHLAAARGRKIAAKMLLRAKADINMQNKKGNTPLALAAESDRNEAVVRLLLESGADAELSDEDQETPFEKARDAHVDMVVCVFREVLKM